MKEKCLTSTLALPIRDVLNRRFHSKPASSSAKETITHHFFCFWNWAEENCRCSQNLWRRNVAKTETQQTFVNGLLGFYALGIYIAGIVCITHNNYMSCPSIWATLSTPNSLIYFWVRFQLFCIVISLSLRVK